MTAVAVLRDRFVRGWPRHEHGERTHSLPLGDAMTRSYSSDAHFAAYTSPIARRLTREAIDAGVAVEIGMIAFDVDCAEAHGTPEPASERWRRALRERVQALAAEHPSPYYYETRGGARILYTIAEPFSLASHDDARRWSQNYAVGCAYLARRFDIFADMSCADWQRLYRLPRATRDAAKAPENWPEWGDPCAIGSLVIDASRDDVALARERCKAFSVRRVTDSVPCVSTGRGLLYHALAARTDVLAERRDGYVIRCPREHEHSAGRTGDGSTMLFPPAPGEEIGAIHCLHGHCSGMRARDWLRCFSDAELERARSAAGIPDRRRAA